MYGEQISDANDLNILNDYWAFYFLCQRNRSAPQKEQWKSASSVNGSLKTESSRVGCMLGLCTNLSNRHIFSLTADYLHLNALHQPLQLVPDIPGSPHGAELDEVLVAPLSGVSTLDPLRNTDGSYSWTWPPHLSCMVSQTQKTGCPSHLCVDVEEHQVISSGNHKVHPGVVGVHHFVFGPIENGVVDREHSCYGQHFLWTLVPGGGQKMKQRRLTENYSFH